METWVQSWWPRTNLSKVLLLPRKNDARSHEVVHLPRKFILANLKIWCSKMQPLSGNQSPDLLTSLMNVSLVLRLPHDMHLCRSSSKVPCLPTFLKLLQNPHVLLTFDKVRNPLRLPGKNDIWTSKSAPYPSAFSTLTSTCASRHNSVHFFDVSTSERGQILRCFVHFDFDMCFAPQRRALPAYTFSTSQLPKVLRTWCFAHFDFETCFAPERRAMFHLSSGQMAPHPPL